MEREGYSLIPLEMQWVKGRAKVTLGLGKGKKEHDKRADTRERDWERERARVMKARR